MALNDAPRRGDGIGLINANDKGIEGPQTFNQTIGNTSIEDPERSKGISIEGLGSLDDIEEYKKDLGEGSGEKVVILHHACMGFVQGRVLRISHLLPTWGNKRVNPNVTKKAAKRLFDLGAIRLALPDEQDADFVQLGEENMSAAFIREQQGRALAEQRLAEMQKAIQSGTYVTNDNYGQTDADIANAAASSANPNTKTIVRPNQTA